jgi:hypothetical protein
LVGVKFSEPDIEISYNLERLETVGIAHTVELLAKNLVTEEEVLVPVGFTVIITSEATKVLAGIILSGEELEKKLEPEPTPEPEPIPEPVPTPEPVPLAGAEATAGIGTGKMIAIGAGALVAAGGVAAVATGSGDETTDDGTPEVVATEQWESVTDNGEGWGNWTFSKHPDRSITADGEWNYDLGAIKCPFTKGQVTISGAPISMVVTGTAVYLGDQTSPFTIIAERTARNGRGSGTYTITFSQTGWSSFSGVWTATRTSGSGITN